MHIFKCACHVGKCKHLTKLIVAGAILFAETFTIYYFDEMTIPVTREKMCRCVCQCGPISKIDKINNKWLLLRTLARFDAYIDWILWCWSYFFVSHACIEVLFVGVLLLKEGAKMAHFKIYLNKVDVCYMFTGATVWMRTPTTNVDSKCESLYLKVHSQQQQQQQQ